MPTLTCPECGDAFDVLPSRAGCRTYCSPECVSAAQRKRVELTCPVCRDPFDVPPSQAEAGHRYCSPECREKGRGVRLTCGQCGDDYRRPPSIAKDSRFCSPECLAASQRDRVDLVCQYCGDTFEVPRSRANRKYCSQVCYRTDQYGPPEELLAAVEEAETVNDVATELRIPYPEARQRLRQHGRLDGLLTAEEIIKRTSETAEAD